MNGAAFAVFGDSPGAFVASPFTVKFGLPDADGVKLGESTFSRFLMLSFVQRKLLKQGGHHSLLRLVMPFDRIMVEGTS